MKQNRIRSISHAQINRETTEILSRNGNRQRLILATLIAASPVMLYVLSIIVFADYLLPVVPESLFSLACVAFGALLALLTLFFTFPLLTGMLSLAQRMEAGEETVLADLFHAFTDRKSYRAALTVSVGAFWKIAVLAVAEIALEAIGQRFLGDNALLWTLMAILMLAVGILLLFLFLGSFRNPYRIFRGTATDRRNPSFSRALGVCYWLGYLPGLLLTVLTFLIYLMADLLPRMLISYFRYCRKAEETEQQLTTQPEESI